MENMLQIKGSTPMKVLLLLQLIKVNVLMYFKYWPNFIDRAATFGCHPPIFNTGYSGL